MRRLLTTCLLITLVGCAPAEATTSPGPALTSVPATTPPSAAASQPPASSAPTQAALEPADLDGMLVPPELAHLLPLVVSIDDSAAARPQSGFNAASMVWQAPADGYESRYLMFFQEADAQDIGPVRSGRLYIAQWAAELSAAFAHYGGDRITRRWIADNTGTLLTSVDGLGSGNGAYHRISSRPAPHNAYTSTEDLRRVALRLGAVDTLDALVHRRPFRDDSPAAERGTAQTIGIPYNTVRVDYAYDPPSNAYLRSTNGKPQIDSADGQRVTARTVIVLFMSFRTDGTIEPGHSRPVLGFIGSGSALVFMEGRKVEARWSKAGPADPTLILGLDGQELSLLRGRIFVQVVPKSTKVSVVN